MLRLLSLLQTHRYWPGGELADRLDVSARTLRRDIERLRELGYQVDAARGVAGGYQLRAGGSLPPLLLEDEEAVAVAVGLRTAAAASVGGMQEWSMLALTKVVALMPPRLRRQMDALAAATESPAPWSGGPVVDAGVLTALAMACRDDEPVTFDYTAPGAETTHRRVEPLKMVTLGRRWYLVAYDRDRQDWRSFRVDRIATPCRAARASARASCPPRTRSPSCSPASAGCPRSTPSGCASPRPPRSSRARCGTGARSPRRATGACWP